MFSERWPRQMSANLSRPVFGDDILLLLVTIILCEAILTNGCALNAHRTAAACSVDTSQNSARQNRNLNIQSSRSSMCSPHTMFICQCQAATTQSFKPTAIRMVITLPS